MARLRQFKAYTTPSGPSVGFLNAVTKARDGLRPRRPAPTFLGQVELIIHGTTLATNTLINRNGARTGMITTRDFRDITEIRRGFKNIRTSMYNVFVPPYEPLVPRHLRLEAAERSTYDGEIVTALDEAEVRVAAERLTATRASRRSSSASCTATPTPPTSSAPARSRARSCRTPTSQLPRDPAGLARVRALLHHARLRLLRARSWSATCARWATGSSEEGFTGNLLMMLSDGLVETRRLLHPARRLPHRLGSGRRPVGRLAHRRRRRQPQHPVGGHGRHLLRHLHGARRRDPDDHRGVGPGRAGGHQDGGHPVGRRRRRLDRLDRPAGPAARGPRSPRAAIPARPATARVASSPP